MKIKPHKNLTHNYYAHKNMLPMVGKICNNQLKLTYLNELIRSSL